MVIDVEQEMYLTFGTKDKHSASRQAQTWSAMVVRPSAYININVGFDNEQDVVNYATPLLDKADAYGIWTIERIEIFKAAVSSL